MSEANKSLSITTPVFRVSFPSVFKARRNEQNGKDEFSVQALFPKGTDLSAMKKMADAACVKKWGLKAAEMVKSPKFKNPFRDQGEKIKDGKLPEGCEAGAIFMTFKSTNRPTVVDQDVQEILEPAKFYAGCYARANVGAFAYETKGNIGVSFGLNHVQFYKDGPPLSGRPTVESAFEPITTTEAGGSADSLF